MKELIETREDVIANIKTLYSYLNNESDKNSYEWAIERLSKGRNYVVEIIDSQICFAPSRFVGYKKNTKKKHSGENQGDGKETDPQLKKLYKIVQDGRLDELFQSEIRQYGLSSGSKKYFISKDMTVDEILKYADNPNADKYVNLLKSNHNLILTGAPGTGKTYLAKQIAQAMGCTDNEIGFVQFHPSYDYTDFVEGLRPMNDDSGNVGFERKDGVFKEFCAKALENLTDSQKSLQTLQQETSVRDLIDDFVQDAIDSDLKLETQGTKNVFHIIENKAKHITIDIPKNEKTRVIALPKSDLITLLENKVDISGSKDIQLYFQRKYRTQQDSYTYVLYEKLKSLESKTKVETVSLIPKKSFVFIIDEINRGEINKIFGELFFSIDPGYRGEKGRVQTQYQNMVEDGDAFKKGFFVPENVYIIGTMNDIDRSVESMDFAFRRRFAFKEIKANDEMSISMLDSDDAWEKDKNGNTLKPDDETIKTVKEKLASINKVIWHKPKNDEKEEDKPIEGLSSAYHIGASYFLKLANYKEDGSYNFDELWEYHLEGLLFEYLRGTTDIYKKLKRLAIAYGYSNADKYE
ncbi:MAG: AAA family ATPase [Salinivirgaceae bacterium]|nr:AAA family ATPase [Salinivirgaceae bacterium]